MGLPSSTASPTNVNLIYHLVTNNNQTPPSAVGPGDVLLSYAVRATAGLLLTGINLTNDAITGPVTIGELACRVMFTPTGTCAPADRLAALVALPGETPAMLTLLLFGSALTGLGLAWRRRQGKSGANMAQS
ncbi:MAG TPA: hypothetical protein VNC82_19775 [Candidatus Limnocylindria bacterium]|nr:hypothetical protein [Candidatus Limnocylindria bacterium]